MQKPYEIIHAIEYIYDIAYQSSLRKELEKLHDGVPFNWDDLVKKHNVNLTDIAVNWTNEDFEYFVSKFEVLNNKLNLLDHSLIKVVLPLINRQAKSKGYIGDVLEKWSRNEQNASMNVHLKKLLSAKERYWNNK